MNVIFEFQESEEHTGKTPGKLSHGARLRKRLVELERHLEHQIAEERYEAAAAVRDQIREIEVKLKADVSEREQE
jgi:protein arginine kinase activator